MVIEQVTEATQIAYAVFAPIAWGILWLACLSYHAGAAMAEWWHSSPAECERAEVQAKFKRTRKAKAIS